MKTMKLRMDSFSLDDFPDGVEASDMLYGLHYSVKLDRAKDAVERDGVLTRTVTVKIWLGAQIAPSVSNRVERYIPFDATPERAGDILTDAVLSAAKDPAFNFRLREFGQRVLDTASSLSGELS